MSSSDYKNGKPGGWITPKHAKKADKRMAWTDAVDRELLLFSMGKEIKGKDHQKIAASFTKKPTPKAIQERFQKLRREQMGMIKEAGMKLPDSESDGPSGEEEEEGEQEDAGAETPGATTGYSGLIPSVTTPENQGFNTEVEGEEEEQ